MKPATSVLAVAVEPRHLCRLAAEKGAAIVAARRREAFHDLHCDVGIESAGGEIVEKEERLRALDEDVVGAVIDEIDTDCRVDAGHERQAQLGADAIGARDQHRIIDSGRTELEEAAEGANLRQHARRECLSRQRADAAHDFIASIDVDAGLLVIHWQG